MGYLRRGGWIVILLAVFALVPIYAGIVITRDAGALDRTGVETEAVVIDLVERSYRSGQRSISVDPALRTRKSYAVTVRYPVGDRVLTATDDVSARFFRTLSRGDEVPIRYLPDDPTRIEIEPGGTRSNGVWAFAVAVMVLALAGVAHWVIQRHHGQLLRLRDTGQRRTGTIASVATLQGGHRLAQVMLSGAATPTPVLVPKRIAGTLELPEGAEVEVLTDPEDRIKPRLAAELDTL